MNNLPPILTAYDQIHQRLMRVLATDMFFIVGCQKSGTTWLEHLLNGHPNITCRGEAIFGNVLRPALANMLAVYNQHSEKRNKQVGTKGREMQFNEAQLDYLFMTAAALMMSNWIGQKDVRVIGEKTPEHAVLIPLLDKYFPRAKFIHIIRDGRDVAVSGWFHNLRHSGDAFRARFPDMPSYIRYLVDEHWKPYISKARDFAAAAPDRYFEIRYEDLHDKPGPTVAAMLRFLGVDDSESAVAACMDAGSFERLSKGRAAGEEDKSSFFRKGVAGDWRNHLDAAAIDAFMLAGGDFLRELGYAA